MFIAYCCTSRVAIRYGLFVLEVVVLEVYCMLKYIQSYYGRMHLCEINFSAFMNLFTLKMLITIFLKNYVTGIKQLNFYVTSNKHDNELYLELLFVKN